MNRWAVPSRIVMLLAANAWLCGCGEPEQTGPPKLHLGEDVCKFCSMIISDHRYAAACVVRLPDGRHQTDAFDDIGCLLNYEKSLLPDAITHRYAIDYETGDWLDAETAHYTRSAEIPSPMASGVIASAMQSQATALAERFGGSVLRFNQLTTPTDETPE